MLVIFLDEVQNVKEFQKAVDGLYIKKNVDLYITGSNAYLLSGELATLLSGRYIEIKMLPLSFKEYKKAFIDAKVDNQKLFLEYMRNGGMPGILQILENNYKDLDKYLDGIFSTVVYKDVMARNNINLLARDYKYYVVDTGLRSYLLGKKADKDMGHILENIVYLELLRRGYNVYVGKVDDLEVDFVAKNREGLKYYQVALTVRDENVLKRELKSLEKTGDHYPKYLLTMNYDLDTDYNGIKKINVIDWLLEE